MVDDFFSLIGETGCIDVYFPQHQDQFQIPVLKGQKDARGNAFLQRDLFVRRYWYATDVAALSKMFRMTQSHVTMTLSRLRKRLQKYLQKEGLL